MVHFWHFLALACGTHVHEYWYEIQHMHACVLVNKAVIVWHAVVVFLRWKHQKIAYNNWTDIYYWREKDQGFFLFLGLRGSKRLRPQISPRPFSTCIEAKLFRYDLRLATVLLQYLRVYVFTFYISRKEFHAYLKNSSIRCLINSLIFYLTTGSNASGDMLIFFR